MEPAAGECFGGGGGIFEAAGHHIVAAQQDPPIDSPSAGTSTSPSASRSMTGHPLPGPSKHPAGTAFRTIVGGEVVPGVLVFADGERAVTSVRPYTCTTVMPRALS